MYKLNEVVKKGFSMKSNILLTAQKLINYHDTNQEFEKGILIHTNKTIKKCRHYLVLLMFSPSCSFHSSCEFCSAVMLLSDLTKTTTTTTTILSQLLICMQPKIINLIISCPIRSSGKPHSNRILVIIRVSIYI